MLARLTACAAALSRRAKPKALCPGRLVMRAGTNVEFKPAFR
jgi:hypothetical protein